MWPPPGKWSTSLRNSVYSKETRKMQIKSTNTWTKSSRKDWSHFNTQIHHQLGKCPNRMLFGDLDQVYDQLPLVCLVPISLTTAPVPALKEITWWTEHPHKPHQDIFSTTGHLCHCRTTSLKFLPGLQSNTVIGHHLLNDRISTHSWAFL